MDHNTYVGFGWLGIVILIIGYITVNHTDTD